MKANRILLLILVGALMASLLVACSPAGKLKGKWEVREGAGYLLGEEKTIEIIMRDMRSSSDKFDMYIESPKKVILLVEVSGNTLYVQFDLSVSKEDLTISYHGEEQVKVGYSLEDDVLTLTYDDGSNIVLERIG